MKTLYDFWSDECLADLPKSKRQAIAFIACDKQRRRESVDLMSIRKQKYGEVEKLGRVAAIGKTEAEEVNNTNTEAA